MHVVKLYLHSANAFPQVSTTNDIRRFYLKDISKFSPYKLKTCKACVEACMVFHPLESDTGTYLIEANVPQPYSYDASTKDYSKVIGYVNDHGSITIFIHFTRVRM